MSKFLNNGQKVTIFEGLKNGYLVKDLYESDRGNGAMVTEVDGEPYFVEKLYDKAPVLKFNKEVEALLQTIREKRIEHTRLNSDLSVMKKQKTDLSRFIINRAEIRDAKRITVFVKNQIEPKDLDLNKVMGMKISIEIQLITGEEKGWVAKLYGDSWGSSDHLDQEVGFILDATDGKIIEIAQRRAARDSKLWLTGVIARCPDEYLPAELLASKMSILDSRKRHDIETLEKKIKEDRLKLKELKDTK